MISLCDIRVAIAFGIHSWLTQFRAFSLNQSVAVFEKSKMPPFFSQLQYYWYINGISCLYRKRLSPIAKPRLVYRATNALFVMTYEGLGPLGLHGRAPIAVFAS